MRYKRIVGGVLAALCCGSPARLSGQCDALTGEVAVGESYQRAFGDGLLFRLRPAANAPPNPEGWTIEVRDGPGGEHDFVWVATSPYRFSNPRDLTTSFGYDARQVIAWDVRSFGFATGEEEYEALAEAIGFLMFSRPPEMTEAQYEAVYDSIYPRWEARLRRAGRGEFRITDAHVSDPTPDRPRGRIERLAFTVTLCAGVEESAEPETDGGGTSGGQETGFDVPGRPLADGPTVSVEEVARRCLELGWPGGRAVLSDSLVSSNCRVTGAGRLGRTGETEWRYALYRRVLVYAPDASTEEDLLPLFPDTIREEEVLAFAGPVGSDRTRAVWQDRSDARFVFLRSPRAVPLDTGGALLLHRRCMNGTGGCQDYPFRLGAEGTVVSLEPSYLDALEAALPQEWGTWKGTWIQEEGPTARAGVHLPGNANCCPAFHAEAPLRVEGERLVADTILVRPDTIQDFWWIDPSEGRIGPVEASTSEAVLRSLVGDSQVERAEVYLGEGRCSVGARLFPGTPWELEVAWADSSRSRPAFARVTSPGPPSDPDESLSPFHTRGGVRLGTSLDRLTEIAGGPIRFSGFNWDYGGGTTWTAEGGRLFLRLGYSRRRLEGLQSSPDSVRLREVIGDRSVSSDHPLADRLGIRVVSIGYEWGIPEAVRFCG